MPERSQRGGRGQGGQARAKGLKQHLPVKPCATCGRPMAWRRRWARCWDEVRHCSDACRQRARPGGGPAPLA